MTATEPAVVRMGRDIARQFGHLPADSAAEQTAAHIVRFWEPRMRAELAAYLARPDIEVDPVLRAAGARL